MAITLYGGARSRASMPRWYMEEKGIAYQWQQLDMEAGEHRQEPFLSINPFGKVPALVDTAPAGGGAPITMFESTAMLIYLADKTGKFGGKTVAEKADVTKWLIFSIANTLPIFSIMREHKDLEPQGEKILDVFETQLASNKFLAGDYSIADMAPVTRLAAFVDHD